MIRLLQWLIYGHCHKWKILEKVQVKSSDGERLWTRHYCQCETCGVIKSFDGQGD
jgi:hypothetical protein